MALLKYSAARLGLVALIFALGLLLRLGIVMSLIVALVASFCISYLFFGRLRAAAAAQVGNRITGRTGRRSTSERDDAAAEDGYWDEHEQVAPRDDENPGPERDRDAGSVRSSGDASARVANHPADRRPPS
ncbi:hypothetical protein BKD30_04380 [Tersicoccus phoenicis]|uniref:DUF4229 domain-containing protein n=1 Tax=Tersicoccus phoenicis TaxID=554083 RepID=A0A1R1LHH1_9MICC|nr:DUF4229 domain-containing protein [Tersicoccus phoenicis]OMH26985.1 hypothetical protein BKD30_04380 [Tersicoccus phoenicis]